MKDKEDTIKKIIEILNMGIKTADPYNAVKKYIKLSGSILKITSPEGEQYLYDLRKYKNIYVFGMGKATAPMAKALEESLKERLNYGHIIVKYGYSLQFKKIICSEAGHPIPDSNGLKNTREIISKIEEISNDDLIFFVISGGGSALLIQPIEPINLRELQVLTNKLLSCGATINEINTIRKHISVIKGGNLARIAYPATIITLIISDVIGDPLDTIASGPTAPDYTTFYNVKEIIIKYKLEKKIPESIRKVIEDGLNNKIPETPKKGDPVFNNLKNIILCKNRYSLISAERVAKEMGYNTMILSSSLYGEAQEIAKVFAAIARETLNYSNPVKKPACIMAGGETTVTLKGNGLGGRNQELALAFAKEMDDLKNVVFLSGGTDGTDGPTDAAGAYVSDLILNTAKKKNLDLKSYLANNDSYHFFEKVGGLLKTGPTNTNIMDIQILIIE